MRVDRGRLNWGIFFIVLGAIPLAYHQGAVSASVLEDAWRLWPLVIVGIGLAFVLSRTPAYSLGGTVVAVCLGLVFGSVLAIGPNIGCGGSSHNPRSISQSGSFGTTASVQLDLDCGSATVSTASDGQWHVNASNTAGRVPTISATASRLQVSSAGDKGWWFDRGTDDWQIQLPSNTEIDLTANLDVGDARFNLASTNLASARFSVNVGSLRVDLTGAQVDNLNVSTNVGSASLILDGSSDLTATLSADVGSLEVCIPAGLGVQVTISESLSSSDFAGAGLVRVGGVWQTPDYATAAHKANLNIDTSLGSVRLRAAGGCK